MMTMCVVCTMTNCRLIVTDANRHITVTVTLARHTTCTSHTVHHHRDHYTRKARNLHITHCPSSPRPLHSQGTQPAHHALSIITVTLTLARHTTCTSRTVYHHRDPYTRKAPNLHTMHCLSSPRPLHSQSTQPAHRALSIITATITLARHTTCTSCIVYHHRDHYTRKARNLHIAHCLSSPRPLHSQGTQPAHRALSIFTAYMNVCYV